MDVTEKGTRRSSARGDGDGGYDDRLESGSCASTSTLASLRDLDSNEMQLIEEDPFERCLDALYEKRSVSPQCCRVTCKLEAFHPWLLSVIADHALYVFLKCVVSFCLK